MTDCAVCPALLCMSRTSLGLPPIASISSESSNADPNSSNNSTGTLIGGIVGGLVGFGILLGIGIYCYIKKNKRDRLPFAFTSGNASYISQSQEKFHQQGRLQSPQQVIPHPAVIAALSQQSSIISSSSSKHRERANLASGNSIVMERQKSTPSATSVTAARLKTIQTPLYNIDNSLSNANTDSTTTTTTSRLINVPEEFEPRIAGQNKRISKILNNNTRASQPQMQHAQQRHSGYTSTDEDFDSEEEDRKSAFSSSTVQSDYSPQTAKTASVQAIQVARAKPQIMRVNSVKSTNGLNRSESVRTILTVIDDIQDFPSTPENHSAIHDNPFQDKHNDNTTP
ncbi:hypothetical protein [Parasitella parasitica]|uniref:Uncharacterized protein n=1 Tax=Parasitella parasitica TaxID=35722 RepID=A0A0B7NNW3_9FUNG|nr:hypothetical protein [Parasitella parasitica]